MVALLHMDPLIQENVIYILSKHKLYLEIAVKKKQIQIKTLVFIIMINMFINKELVRQLWSSF